MWPSQPHTLAPLTKLTSINRKCEWTKVEQYVFNKIMWIVACDTISTYPDFNETFKTYTDASMFQLGSIIRQKGKHINLRIITLSDAQQWYTVTDKELRIAETLNEFRTILIGRRLRIYTDHKNLACKHFNTNRVLRWRLILEEYGPEIEFIKGEKI